MNRFWECCPPADKMHTPKRATLNAWAPWHTCGMPNTDSRIRRFFFQFLGFFCVYSMGLPPFLLKCLLSVYSRFSKNLEFTNKKINKNVTGSIICEIWNIFQWPPHWKISGYGPGCLCFCPAKTDRTIGIPSSFSAAWHKHQLGVGRHTSYFDVLLAALWSAMSTRAAQFVVAVWPLPPGGERRGEKWERGKGAGVTSYHSGKRSEALKDHLHLDLSAASLLPKVRL